MDSFIYFIEFGLWEYIDPIAAGAVLAVSLTIWLGQ
jgi:hypothetical protein